jgi:hypothetical protein
MLEWGMSNRILKSFGSLLLGFAAATIYSGQMSSPLAAESLTCRVVNDLRLDRNGYFTNRSLGARAPTFRVDATKGELAWDNRDVWRWNVVLDGTQGDRTLLLAPERTGVFTEFLRVHLALDPVTFELVSLSRVRSGACTR